MKEIDWSQYIEVLDNFPSLKQQWEKDFVKTLEMRLKELGKIRVLEVGCSNGRWLRWFYTIHKCEIYGIDLDTSVFQRDFHFVRGDARILPFKNGAFDVVFSIGLVEHFKRNERFTLLREQSRVLSDKGLLICLVPNLYCSLEYFWVKFFYDYLRGYHHYVVTKRELLQTFQELGLKIIHFSFIGIFRELNLLIKFKRFILLNLILSDSMLFILKKCK
jgi:SAM-dependent methyltransferase